MSNRYLNAQKRPAKYVIKGMTQADSTAASESGINLRLSKDIRAKLLDAKASNEIRKKRIIALCQFRFERKVHKYWPVNETVKAIRNATRLAIRALISNCVIKVHTMLIWTQAATIPTSVNRDTIRASCLAR